MVGGNRAACSSRAPAGEGFLWALFDRPCTLPCCSENCHSHCHCHCPCRGHQTHAHGPALTTTSAAMLLQRTWTSCAPPASGCCRCATLGRGEGRGGVRGKVRDPSSGLSACLPACLPAHG